MKLTNMQIGRAGELRVMSELLLRGFEPALVLNDNGVDIVLTNGTKIQVKTSRKTMPSKCNTGSERYCFNLSRHKGTQDCDFLIAWCVDDNRFLIISLKDTKRRDWKFSSAVLKGENLQYCNFKDKLIAIDNWEVLRGGSSS